MWSGPAWATKQDTSHKGPPPAPRKAMGRGSPSGNDIGGGRGQPAVVATAALISVSWCLSA